MQEVFVSTAAPAVSTAAGGSEGEGGQEVRFEQFQTSWREFV